MSVRALVLSVLLVFISCKKEEKSHPQPPTSAAKPSAAKVKPARPVVAKTPKAEGGKTYRVDITPPKEGKAGEDLVATVTLVPLGEYKVNQEYPTKLSATAASGVKPATLVLKKKEAASFSEKSAVFKPAFVAGTAGKYRVDAVFKFSVCTEKVCELKTEKLHWFAAAK